MREHLFVYGTLAPGRVNHYLLAGIAGQWQQASTAGILYPDGLGAVLGYPVLVPSDLPNDTKWVAGWLFCSDELSGHWQRLDAFEGPGYRRVQVPVFLPHGETTTAFVYAFNG